jgi:hypothetical protein
MRAVLLAALLLALAASASAAKQPPTIRVVETSPLTARGAAFPARRIVTVTVRQDGRLEARRSVRASRAGAFVVAFPGTSVHRCGGGTTTVTAVSSTGAVAKAKLPQTLCPPPLAAL